MNPTCSANMAPPMAAKMAADAEGEDLEVGDAVAGEADPVLLFAHRDQDAAELRVPDELRDEDADEQQPTSKK